MKRQEKGLIFIFMLALCSDILSSIGWNSAERDDIIEEPTEDYDEQFYIDCLEKLIGMPIAAAGYDNPLNYSTYIGGIYSDKGNSIAIDSDGSVYITGYTTSPDFSTTTGAFDEIFNGGSYDVFVCKLSADGSTLVYSTFIGGSKDERGNSIAIDVGGNAYITGYTQSENFTTTTGVFDEIYNGRSDVFVCKLSADGSTLVYSTFIGGNESENGYSIAVDSDGIAYITGRTESSDFTTTTGAFDEIFNGGSYDVFVCKLSADGSNLVYSTFIGGDESESGYSIAIDTDGSAYITGFTKSENFITTTGAFDETHNGGPEDVFVCKLSADGSTLLYSTYIGGISADEGHSIAIGLDGIAYITGRTESSDFTTTTGAFDEIFNEGNCDVFVCKLSADGSTLLYSTYIGGISDDEGDSVSVDVGGNAYITGNTYSTNFPTTTGAFDETKDGSYEVFVCKLSADGSFLVYSTYIGGGSSEYGNSITVGVGGNVCITGYTGSSSFDTTTGAFDEIWNGATDAFICKFNKFPDPPGPFSLTSPDAGTLDDDGQFTLNWGISEGADNYTVYWDTVPFITYTGAQDILVDESDVNSAPFSTSQNGTYYFRVCAKNRTGERYSDAGFLQVIVALPPPGPFSLTSPDAGSPDNDGQFILNWGISEGADNYTVYWDTVPFITYTGAQNILVDESDVNSAPFSTLQSANFYFRVCSKNETGERYSDSGCLKIVVTYPQPASFSLTSPDAGIPDYDGQFNLEWNISVGAENYTVYWDIMPFTNYTGTQNILIDELNVTTAFFSTSETGIYYFRVRARNLAGEIYSNTSCLSIVTMIAPPVALMLYSLDAGTPDDDGKFTLTWTSSFNADNYTLYMLLNADFTTYNGSQTILVNEQSITNYSVTLTQDGIYYFRVCAKNSFGEEYSDSGAIQVFVQIKRPTTDDTTEITDEIILLLTVFLGILAVFAVTATITILHNKRKRLIALIGSEKDKFKRFGGMTDISIKYSSWSEKPQVDEGQQPFYVPQSSKIGVYCASCHLSHSITREQFDHFTCRRCGNYFFNLGYFCRNCSKIYPISKEDYINLQEPEVVRCFKCNNVAEITKTEE